MVYLESHETGSDFNLALEQYVFDRMPRGESYLMLWQNRPAVIIGKYQNALEELHTGYVRKHGIQVTRRLSGGGAVYHDLGSINYTYIVDGTLDGSMDLAAFCRPLLETLQGLGIHAELTGRNDISIEGKKVSGNAQYSREGRIMHHGTILYDSDLSMLNEVLRVPADKIVSKGIKSVRSRVANIREYLECPLSVQEFWSILRERMCGGRAKKTYDWTRTDLEEVDKIRRERYGTWEWNWGNSPACTIRKERRIEGCGGIQVYLDIQNGRISDCEFYGDFFGEGPSKEFLQALEGCPLSFDGLEQALLPVDVSQCFYHLSREQLIELLLQ